MQARYATTPFHGVSIPTRAHPSISIRSTKRGRGRPPGSLNRNNEAYLVAKYANTYASQEPCNLETVGALIDKCAVGKRCPSDAEKSFFITFKEWAPKRDLQSVIEALGSKKELLVQALRTAEPEYEAPCEAPCEAFQQPTEAAPLAVPLAAPEACASAPASSRKRKAAPEG
jgi:hypothetical protein